MTETQTSTAVSSPPRGELTVRALIAAVLVAAIMGASYPYMVLKLGFGPNVSVVAAFFGFIILNVIGRASYDRWQNNIVQTAGTSAAQTAFMCVLLGAFDMLRDATHGKFGVVLEPYQAFLWLTVAGGLGVLMAVPLRRHFVVDEKLPFVDGVATGETLMVLDPPRGRRAEDRDAWLRARRAAIALMIGVVLSALLMWFREDAKLNTTIPEGWDPGEIMIGVGGAMFVVANMGVGVSYSLLSIGSGMLIGMRINASMMLGAVLAWIVIPAFLMQHGVIGQTFLATGKLGDSPSRTQILYWVMWPATGMLVAGGLAALGMRWRLLLKTFTSLRGAHVSSSEFPLKWVGIGVGVFSVLLIIVQYAILDMPPWLTLAAIILSVPLMLVGLRVLGETNWGPISALSNMMQGLFAVVAPGNVTANMVASGTTGTIATSSEAIMQDFRAGEMIGSTPRAMTIAQLVAVPIGAAAVAWTYPLLVSTYGITGDNAGLTSPISRKWAGFAQLLKDGVSSLEPSALWALLIFAVLGVIFTILESNPKVKDVVPSPTGIGIGMLVPFSVVATMFLGGVVGLFWERGHKKSSDQYMVPLASGLIAGEALVAVIVPVILAALTGLTWYGLVSGKPFHL